jgi:NADPH:quinone reductase-like Zn-dependent oxidoreductase
VGYQTAAATLWTYTTPLNCMQQAPVGLGDTVLITGASGGMATACAQLAKLSGATVIGTTSKSDRDEQLAQLGYDHILHSADPDLAAQVTALTHGRGADTVWDRVGGNSFLQLSVSCVRLGGTVVVMAAPVEKGALRKKLELNVVHGAAGRRKDQPGHRPGLPVGLGRRGTRLPRRPSSDRQSGPAAVTRHVS